MKTIKPKALQEFIIRRVKASLKEIKALEEMYETSSPDGVGLPQKANPEALELVTRATRMVTHDDPNAVGRFYNIMRSMKRNMSDMYTSPEEYYIDIADEFLSMATNEEGVSDNDGETPRMTPDDFYGIDKVDLGTAVQQHFSK